MLPLVVLSIILPSDTINAQTPDINLDEVTVVSTNNTGRKRSVKGQSASIDEHLSELSHVNLVRRGSYAWEPTVNNMQTERLSTTIDGMKIFYACTDKMDPVTSYVESGNLQTISLNSGLDGNPQATGNIGGSLDLRLRKTGFDAESFEASALAGFESNGQLQVYGLNASTSKQKFYANGGAFYRHADNYRTGGGNELQFSQFQKLNAFANAGFRFTERNIAEATFIFDRATDVGYPALNMDVAKAEGLIGSLSFTHQFVESWLNSWQTKVYANRIEHIMDDTHRPDVEIHMDMPGLSRTAGFYSLLTASSASNSFQLNADGYYNRLFADMTMYPGGAAPMYMVTWPDVGTLNVGLAGTANLSLTDKQSLRLSTKLAWQRQHLNNDEGYHALKVFFPQMGNLYHQITGRVAATYTLSLNSLTISAGTGWGSRAPTVTEAYGYYLNNTFDQYDYIGNPHLKNESALELNTSTKWQPISSLSIKIDGSLFRFANYIIGHFETRLSAMTVGAEGVKVYGNSSHATIANADFSAQWSPSRRLRFDASLSYAHGSDNEGDALPLIAPFGWSLSATYTAGKFEARADAKGNGRQNRNGEKYGEQSTPAYYICGLSAQYALGRLTARAGIENLFDRYYHTYSDWCGIPQKGRNIYVNLNFDF